MKVERKEILKLAITVAAIILVAVGFQFGSRALLRTDTPFTYVPSGSMRPSLEVGDLIIAEGIADPSGIEAGPPPNGTIIIFEPTHSVPDVELAIHRVIHKEFRDGEWYYTTRGDANTRSWYWETDIPEENVKGKMLWRIPYLGYVPMALQTTLGRAFVVILLILLIASMFYDVLRPQKLQIPS